MIFATIEFTRLNRPMVAHLTDSGWTVPELPALSDSLSLLFSLDEYGPADGDPVYRAAWKAAELLKGQITWVREPSPLPPGAVY